jgi:hypothetical protein
MDSNIPSSSGTPFEEIVVEISSEEAGGHGDHWKIFFHNLKDFFTRLPQIIQEAQPALTYADIRSAIPYIFPKQEPDGYLLVWPIPRFGLIATIKRNSPSAANELISAYPWVSEGKQHTIRMEQIRLWPNRLEAQIEAGLGIDEELPITFFDPLFAANRVFYKKGEWYQFILVGFPYTFEIVDPKPIVINDPEKIRNLRSILHSDDPERRESQEPLIFETKGMAALLPHHDLEGDDYEFQGPVKSVTEFHTEMFGQRTWRIRITIHRRSDKDFDLDLCLTEKILGNQRMPEAGDDVRGILWLQGYLWMPGLG